MSQTTRPHARRAHTALRTHVHTYTYAFVSLPLVSPLAASHLKIQKPGVIGGGGRGMRQINKQINK